MNRIFLKIINISISVSWLILVVLLLRLALKKAPKWANVLLWGIVAIRLICPFSIESAMSLIPSAETIPETVISGPRFEIRTGVGSVDDLINEYLGDHYFEGVTVPPENGFRTMSLLTVIWCIGILSLIAYASVSYWRLCRRVSTAVYYKDNIYRSENISSPFVLGIINPRIYLPFGVDGHDTQYIVAHEQAHIARKDNLWKPIGFLLLTVYWFNPLIWVAYVLFCRDIELACDESVIKNLVNEQRAQYTQTLVDCSINRTVITVCPLAFGEIGIRERVKSVMEHKKPTTLAITLTVITCISVAICFLTNPMPPRDFLMKGNNISHLEPSAIVKRILDIEDWESSNIYTNSNNFALTVDSNFNWAGSQAIRYFFSNAHTTYLAQLRVFPDEGKYVMMEPTEWVEQGRIFLLQNYLEAIKYLPQDTIREMAQADRYIIRQIDGGQPADYDRAITYCADGVQETDGWYLHLQIDPVHSDGEGYSGTGEEVIHAFYGPKQP
ncbi:MAG: M56 family metallopeptidase [Ruminococcaceae bacterium]|nr:M56 family metallopeptidase [Oscillospiraceae bacterium]